jgi:uracil-DNA glycosylase family 4
MFTGDGSGQWLIESLHITGFASQPSSRHRRDGLRLLDAYITAPVRCAPPANRPTREELTNCLPFLEGELRLLARLRVVVALGKFGFDAYLSARRRLGLSVPRPRPPFRHGSVTRFPDGTVLIASYHPSQQNTFTGKLTRSMLRAVFSKARRLLNAKASLP